MKYRVLQSLMLLAVFSTGSAQSLSQQEPFTLKLSVRQRDAALASWQTRLVVRLTNTSNESISEDTCSAFGGLYRVSTIFNGVRQKEPEEDRRHREEMETGRCNGSNPGRTLNPGASWDDTIYIDTPKAGTYQFVVDRLVTPGDSKSGRVSSNAVTMSVSQPVPEAK